MDQPPAQVPVLAQWQTLRGIPSFMHMARVAQRHALRAQFESIPAKSAIALAIGLVVIVSVLVEPLFLVLPTLFGVAIAWSVYRTPTSR